MRTRITAAAVAGGLGLAGLGLSLALPLGATAAESTPDPTAGSSADVRQDVTERIRDALQGLVDDGTLDADQADAVAGTLAEQVPGPGDRPDPGGPGPLGPFGPGDLVDNLAAALDISVDEVVDALRSGATPAEVIEENGGDVDVIVDGLVEDAEAALDELVADGRLDAERADDLGARAEDHIRMLVEEGLPARGPGGLGERGGSRVEEGAAV